jgi:diguanylate cyclase (GGDEF)-like protein/PAS domain S-box-containing protein
MSGVGADAGTLPAAPIIAWLLRCIVLALACCGAAWLGAEWLPPGAQASLLWGCSGVALAALVRWGVGHWPGILIGCTAAAWLAGAPPAAAAIIGASQTVGPALAAAWLLRRDFSTRLDRRQDLVVLLYAAVGSAALTSLGTCAWLALAGVAPWADWATQSSIGFLGALLGGLVFGVPLLTLGRRSMMAALDNRSGEVTLLLVVAALVSATLAFSITAAALPRSVLTLFALLSHVLLCVVIMRRGFGLACAAALLIALGAGFATVRGQGPFQHADPAFQLGLLWGYAASLSALMMLAAAIAAEFLRLEERSRLALASSDLGVADWELRGGRGFTSTRWRSLLADPGGKLTGTLPDWLRRVHGSDRDTLAARIEGLALPGHDSVRQDLCVASGNEWRHFDCQLLVAERADDGAPRRLIASLVDITDRRGAEERLQLSASLFQHLHEGLLITDAEFRVLDVNPAYLQITGEARAELLGKVPKLLQARADADAAAPDPGAPHAAMWSSLRAVGAWRGEIDEQRPDGEPCALQVTISVVRGPDGRARHHVLVISDITEPRLQRERLERQAHFDELTRLPNRSRLTQMLAEAMQATERDGSLLAVCYLDLDHFKPVNDQHGHAAGDRLLVELAHRLRGALRNLPVGGDAAARFGGDEFVLLMRAGTLDEARLAVERVLRVISQPYALELSGEPVHVTASVGATVFPLDRSDADTLLRHADQAMYGAKQAGRNGYLFFDPEDSRRNQERVMAIGRVQEALDRHELLLHYQPKVDMRRGVVLGVEALLRWNHPEHGLIPPAQFLPLIEHTGLSARVGDWVLEHALEQLAQWQQQGLDLSVSVNVSARHLQEPEFAQRLAELLARYPRALGSRLELEVLETAALADVDYTSSLLERCRRLGVRFALDDFGTGYSTLTYLKRLPVDVLKIDRSFVHNMLTDRQDLAIVEGVISLARTFGCVVVAEGVETPAQAKLLTEMGCDIGQGQGISWPMPAGEVAPWVSAFRGLAAAHGPSA